MAVEIDLEQEDGKTIHYRFLVTDAWQKVRSGYFHIWESDNGKFAFSYDIGRSERGSSSAQWASHEAALNAVKWTLEANYGEIGKMRKPIVF